MGRGSLLIFEATSSLPLSSLICQLVTSHPGSAESTTLLRFLPLSPACSQNTIDQELGKDIVMPKGRCGRVVIDSLSMWVLNSGVTSVYHGLRHLLENHDEVLACMVSESLSECDRGALLQLADRIVTLSGTSQLNPLSGTIKEEIRHEKSGRREMSEKEYSIDPEHWTLSTERVARVKEAPTEKNGVHPLKVTMELGVSEGERRAREELELPHTARIHYTPAEEDDWDEEDPDDDLDI